MSYLSGRVFVVNPQKTITIDNEISTAPNVSYGSGNSDASTQRVILANNQQTINTNITNASLDVNVLNQVSSVSISNFPSTTEISNFPTTTNCNNSQVQVSNFPLSFQVSNFPTTTNCNNSQVQVSNLPAIQYVDVSPHTSKICDAFNRVRVSNPVSIFDSNFISTKQTGRWAEKITGDGVVNYTSGLAYVELSSASTGSIIRQTRRYITYQPAKSFLIYLTGSLCQSALVANQTSKIGFYDANNGYYIQLAGSTFSVVERTSISGSVVETVVNKANFNGDSSYSIDYTKRNIWVLNYGWLGVSTCSIGVISPTRELIILHTFQHANSGSSLPYLANPSLPCRYEIINTSGSSMKLIQICASVQSEGGYSPVGRIFSFSMTASKALSAEVPILSMRIKSTRPNVCANLLKINPMVISTGAPMAYKVYRFHSPIGAILTGALWTAVNQSSESAMEYDTSASAITFTGSYELVASGLFIDAVASTINDIGGLLFTGRDVDGGTDVIVITLTKINGGANEDCVISVSHQELE